MGQGWTSRDHRYSIDWPVTYSVEGGSDQEDSRIFNISMGGLSLLTNKAFAVGTAIRLLILVPDKISERVLLPNPVPVHGEIIWCRELLEVNQVGVQFIYLNPVIRKTFIQAFDSFSSELVKRKK